MDAVPACSRSTGSPSTSDGDPKRWLRSLRAFVGRRSGDAMLLGEVNLGMKELASYFGDARRRAAHAVRVPHQPAPVARARARQAEPLETVIRALPRRPARRRVGDFLRNHDELTLDKLTVSQRDEVFAAFGPKPGMQLYGHGLRRRAATMLGGDGPRLRMAWSLMFSLPGTPVVFMGDEIGMGEQLRIPDRYAVRVPMQWSRGRNGGFSTAPAGDLVRPLAGGAFGPAEVNVADQRRDPGSLLRFFRRLIRVRRETPELGWGSSTLIETADPALFAHRVEWEGSAVIAIHNLADRPATADLDLGPGATGVHDLLADAEEPARRGRLSVEPRGVWRPLAPGTASLMPYRLDLAADPADALRAAVREQLDDAVRRLRDDRGDDPAEAVHEARKDLKKARSLLRLARPGLPGDVYRRENARCATGPLALRRPRRGRPRRDRRRPRRALRGAAPRRSSPRWARRLAAAGAEARATTTPPPRTPSRRSRRRRAGRATGRSSAATTTRSSTARRAPTDAGARRSRPSRRRPVERLHDLRKRVKDLWYHGRLLEEAWPRVVKAQSKARTTRRPARATTTTWRCSPSVSARGRDGRADRRRGRPRPHRAPPRRAAGRGHADRPRLYAEPPKAFRARLGEYVRAAGAERRLAEAA